MSKEKSKESTSQSSEHQAIPIRESTTSSSAASSSIHQAHQHFPPGPATSQFASLQRPGPDPQHHQHVEEERKSAPKRDLPSETASQSTDEAALRPRQVIAVSASKGPAAFFNLARKFLVTDEMCDLSALEGAIVSAVDAAHLLERSKLASIVRIQTSYVTVEPKRRKQAPGTQGAASSPVAGVTPGSPVPEGIQGYHGLASPGSPAEAQTRRTSSGRELRRARIVITVRRTESYKKWLDENPLQAIIAGDAEDDAVEGADDA